MANMLPYQQIGDNLYADSSGKQFSIGKGTYIGDNGKKIYGDVRNYVQTPFDTQSQKINALYDAQKKQAIANLDKQKQALAPQYQAQRNQADVTNAQNVAKLRELMAANGINASGENITAQANLASQRQNALNTINMNQQDAYNKLDMQANDQANAAEVARAQALNNAWSQYQNDLYRQHRDWVGDQGAAADRAWREYTYNHMSAQEKAQLDWAKKQYGEDAAWRMYELQYNGNLQQSMNNAQIAGYTNGANNLLAGIP